MSRHLLPLIPAGLSVVQVLPGPDRVTILAIPRLRAAVCPVCGHASARVRSRYIRVLADLPWQGRGVALKIRARRFRCGQKDCPRKIFAERLPAAVEPWRRRTARLAEIQRCMAQGMGGEPGSRLATRLARPVGGDTRLRLIRATPIAPYPPARIIGIDDWAWRRGRRYGTLVVDLERNRPIDLLADRRAETVAAWLKANPGIAIVARARAGAYAEGIRAGAPQAVQVTDRWHLLRNLGDAVQDILDGHHRDLRCARKAAVALSTAAQEVATPSPRPASRPLSSRRQASVDRRAARQAAFEEAVALHARGWSQSRIARTVGLDGKPLRTWVHLGRPPAWHQPRRGSAVDHHADCLRRRWTEGCHNATRLWREIRALGFTGQAGVVRDWLQPLRTTDPAPSRPARSWRTPSGRRAAWLVVADADTLDATERQFVDALIAGSPTLARIIEPARQFRRMVRQQQPDDLDTWIAMARSTVLKSFASGLQRDLAAVRAALSLPWSTSPVEGQISRLKMIKRQMCGRAGFDLLRQRVLAAA